jgi:hypothetical protein
MIKDMLYLQQDYDMFAENMQSYVDPNDPDKLTNHLSRLTKEFSQNQGNLDSTTFIFMIDQLAMSLYQIVKIDMNKMTLIDLEFCPDFENIRQCMSYISKYTQGIEELIVYHSETLTKALLCIYVYKHSQENLENLDALCESY